MQDHEKRTPEPYPWVEFKKLWETQKLSVEQAIGQLLVWGQLQHEILLKYERQLEEQEAYIADLAAQVAESKAGDSGE